MFIFLIRYLLVTQQLGSKIWSKNTVILKKIVVIITGAEHFTQSKNINFLMDNHKLVYLQREYTILDVWSH